MTKPLGLQHADKLDTMHAHMAAAEIRHTYKSHARLLKALEWMVARTEDDGSPTGRCLEEAVNAIAYAKESLQ